METLTIMVMILAIFLLGRYAIKDGQRKERQKKMLKDMNKYKSKKL